MILINSLPKSDQIDPTYYYIRHCDQTVEFHFLSHWSIFGHLIPSITS